MLIIYLEQLNIELDSRRICPALGREYSRALTIIAIKDSWNDWHNFSFMRMLKDTPEDIS